MPFRQLPSQRRVLRAVLADQLLVLLNVILHRVDLVFLHPPLAGDEIVLRIALAAAHSRASTRCAQQSRAERRAANRVMCER